MSDLRITLRLAGIGVLGLAALLGPACSAPAKASCPDPRITTDVTVADFSYEPGCISTTPQATLAVTNTGSITHTFTVEGTEVDVDLPAGGTVSVPLSGLQAGVYTVTCRYHPQMVEALRVG
jgi:plastocyanin